MRRGAVRIAMLAFAIAAAAVAAVGAGHARAARTSTCLVSGAREPIDQIWRPDMRAAAAYARHRTGDIAFAVRTDHRFYGYRPDHVEWSASVVKAMLMVGYLDRPAVAHRPLSGYDRSLLVPMITRSDNNAATTVDGIVGNYGLRRLAERVGMSHFLPVANPWGETHITARDQTKFFLHLDSYVVAGHRSYALHLLASITPSQRWGIGEVAPKGWQLFFKGGWGYGTGLLDHQVVLLRRGCARVSLAVLTMYDGSHAYGKATLREMFSRLLRGFPTGAPLYPVVEGARYQSKPGTDSVGFVASAGGQRVFQLTAGLAANACGPPVTYRFGTVGVDPRGNFHAGTPGGSSSITGRILAGRRAAGTITEQQGPCRLTLGWSAKVTLV